MSRFQAGERHHNAKLTADQIREIRSDCVRYVRGKSVGAMARRYSVDRSTIIAVLNGSTWGHVQ